MRCVLSFSVFWKRLCKIGTNSSLIIWQILLWNYLGLRFQFVYYSFNSLILLTSVIFFFINRGINFIYLIKEASLFHWFSLMLFYFQFHWLLLISLLSSHICLLYFALIFLETEIKFKHHFIEHKSIIFIWKMNHLLMRKGSLNFS